MSLGGSAVSLGITAFLVTGTAGLMLRGHRQRRGPGPAILCSAALPLILFQPSLLVAQKNDEIAYMRDHTVLWNTQAATWIGSLTVMFAALWNGSVDKKIMAYREKRRVSARKETRDSAGRNDNEDCGD